MSIFETASRQKIRFETRVGIISTEDLWDLPLTHATKANLDDVARTLFLKLKNDSDVSFVTPAQKSNAIDQLRFDIVKHIIDIKLAERDVAVAAKANAEKKQKLLEILANKENEALGSLSMEELKAQINAM